VERPALLHWAGGGGGLALPSQDRTIRMVERSAAVSMEQQAEAMKLVA
jgi:hypothetical protein